MSQILVVDDEETLRFVLGSVLSDLGHEVSAAGSASEARSLIHGRSFSVALLDLVLPDGGGIELLDQIKSQTPDTEVIIMTSHASVQTAVDAIRKGAYDYLQKPFELDEVSATVTRALERRGLLVRNRELLGQLERQNQGLSAVVRRLESLNAAGLGMSGIHSCQESLDFFLGLVVRELEVDRASIMLLDLNGQMAIVASHGIEDDVVRTTRVQLGEGIAGQVLLSGEPMLVKDVATDPSFTGEIHQHLSSSFISVPIVLSVPIKSSEAVLGVINVTNRRSGVPFDEGDVKYLSGLAGQAAVAIERARHLEELQRAIGSLQAVHEQLVASERLKILGELAAGVAHDLNNTLNGILGRAQLLRAAVEQTRGDSRILRKSLATIEQLALQGATTVKRIQDSARIRKDRPIGSVDLNEAVRTAVDLTRPRWKLESDLMGRPIQVDLDLEDIPPTAGDAQELVQIVSNLIFNAIDAMPQGGRLGFKTSSRDGSILLEVQDTGIGMTPETRQRLFTPFFTTKEAGHGMGLSVAYGIVTRLGGSISVESEPGRGARFLIRLPASRSRNADARAGQAPRDGAARRARVLVVEDEQENRELCRDMLELDGHEAVLASTGEEGLSLLQHGTYDVVITDLTMPGLSGWDLAKAVKQRDPMLPVIILSGWGVQMDEAALREAGVCIALAKPVAVEDLLESVRRAMASVPESKGAARKAA